MRRALTVAALVVALLMFLSPVLAFAALDAAAGGGGTGKTGFTDFVSFLNNVATYLVYVGVAAGALGIIASGGMLIAGSPEGAKWLARAVVGVGIVILAKGIVA